MKRELWSWLNTLLMGIAVGGMFDMPRYFAGGLLLAASISYLFETGRPSNWFGKGRLHR